MGNWYLNVKRVEAARRRNEFGLGMGLGLPLGAAMLMHGLTSTPQGKPQPERPAVVQPASRPTSQPTTAPSSIGQPTTAPAPQPPAATPKATGRPNMTVARIIFSEAAGVSPEERALVAGVIKNRVGNKAFGGASDMLGVVTQRNAFEALNHAENKNWAKSENPAQFNPKEKQVWQHCLDLAAGAIPEAKGKSGRPLVYYHDKSISRPASWSNRYWTAIEEVETPHFIFYSVVPASQR